nr:hypothetical protein [Candidatus Sigynarchaeota archaeon]
IILWNVTLTTVNQSFNYTTQGPKSFYLYLQNPSPSFDVEVLWDVDTDFDAGDDIPGFDLFLVAGATVLAVACSALLLARKNIKRQHSD